LQHSHQTYSERLLLLLRNPSATQLNILCRKTRLILVLGNNFFYFIVHKKTREKSHCITSHCQQTKLNIPKRFDAREYVRSPFNFRSSFSSV